MNIPCILIPAIVGIICGILGYLIGKMNTKNNDTSVFLDVQSELDNCRSNTQKLNAQISALETDLEFCRANGFKLNAKISELSKKSDNNLNSFVSAVNPVIHFNKELALTVFGHKIKENDLKVVEGIGPKIEELYHKAGINTWLKLSQTSVEKSQSILDAGGENFSMHNPGTWARQAELAYSGKWQELKDWQDVLDGGKE